MICRGLRGLEYEVLEACDGVEALAVYRENPADVVITDIMMPEKDGFELIRELKEICPDLKVIAISGGGRRGKLEFLDHAGAFGAQRVLSKPIHLDILVEMVEDLLAIPF